MGRCCRVTDPSVPILAIISVFSLGAITDGLVSGSVLFSLSPGDNCWLGPGVLAAAAEAAAAAATAEACTFMCFLHWSLVLKFHGGVNTSSTSNSKRSLDLPSKKLRKLLNVV